MLMQVKNFLDEWVILKTYSDEVNCNNLFFIFKEKQFRMH